ncbi:hypothetical protein GW17_00045123 [Ensete ventricosum]|nr:hypothetical protein GW17_00045123 [Ensete ventricosum]
MISPTKQPGTAEEEEEEDVLAATRDGGGKMEGKGYLKACKFDLQAANEIVLAALEAAVWLEEGRRAPEALPLLRLLAPLRDHRQQRALIDAEAFTAESASLAILTPTKSIVHSKPT